MTDTNDIEWSTEGPPPKRTPRNDRIAFVELLKTRPGVWAKLPIPVRGQSTGVYKRDFPGTEWSQRSRGDGSFDVWGRWVG